MQDIDEKKWHEKKFYIDLDHWSSHTIFASRERHWLQTEVQKIRFYGYLYRYIKKRPYRNSATILMAPVGSGNDIKYLQGIFDVVHGIDISTIALSKCPNIIIKKEGDILRSGYEEKSFDIIICSLFLHHVHEIGFKPFIKEFFWLLRDGGILAILEPSSMYPFSWVTTLAEKFLGNVSGKVEGERPIFPPGLTKILKISGFEHVHMHGLTFNHVRFPCTIQLLANLINYPCRVCQPFKLFASRIGWFCEKPEK